MNVQVSTLSRRLAAVGLLLTMSASPAAAQDTSAPEVRGRLVHSVTLAPVARATLVVEEAGITTTSSSDGRFVLRNVAPGSYHLVVSAGGYVGMRREVTVDAAVTDLGELRLDPELHYAEVVSVSPEARDRFDAYQATNVLAGQQLAVSLTGSLGTTLKDQPGLAERSFGPAPSRPVIRGLDGDRVLVLEDGQRTGDLSSQSGDHGVSVNPAAATRLEVVRGPATLLYGANAIGGLVNVISEVIPTRQVSGVSGGAQVDLASSAGEAGGAADVLWGNGQFALRAGGSGRHAGDVGTPEGDVENTQLRSGFANLAASFTGERGYFGGSYAYDDTRYGIPIIEDGEIELTPRRHVFNVRGEAREMSGVFSSVRGTLGVRRYRHDEVEGTEIATQFRNNTVDVELLAGHRQVGRLRGSLGVWGLSRQFSAEGEEALSPPVDQNGFALFAYEEVVWPRVTFQFGGRYDRASFRPEGGLPDRDFDNFSGSVGLLLRPTDETTVAVSLARAARNPALEELYFFGPHHGNFAFEIGNPELKSEKARGVDVAFRWRLPRLTGEIAFFRNDIKDYIFRNPISEDEFDRRFGHDDDHDDDHDNDHDGHDNDHDDHGHGHDEFPFQEFVGADSLLHGLEAHTHVHLTETLIAEIGVDYVRGQLKSTNDPLPRIPPLRGTFGLRYQRNALQAGGQWVAVSNQRRVFGEETETEGYGLLKLFGSYSFVAGGAVNTITARLDNAANKLYRNHLSLIKDFVPEMGRNFKLVYSVRF